MTNPIAGRTFSLTSPENVNNVVSELREETVLLRVRIEQLEKTVKEEQEQKYKAYKRIKELIATG